MPNTSFDDLIGLLYRKFSKNADFNLIQDSLSFIPCFFYVVCLLMFAKILNASVQDFGGGKKINMMLGYMWFMC